MAIMLHILAMSIFIAWYRLAFITVSCDTHCAVRLGVNQLMKQ
jgi:hypothetical protein